MTFMHRSLLVVVKLLDLTLPTPAENLACDEALLDWCDENGGEALRFWEPAQHFVVVGYANKIAAEANQAACAENGIGIYRRCSGGGTVLQGPGCLNYALVLQISQDGPLGSITGTNQFVMERNRQAVERAASRPPEMTESAGIIPPPLHVKIRGHTDLAVGDRKFSGNAQRRKRRALLFHGTLLWNFELALIAQFLNLPTLQPCYRQGRSHLEFLMNLPVASSRLKISLQRAWGAGEELLPFSEATIRKLVSEKYGNFAWNGKF